MKTWLFFLTVTLAATVLAFPPYKNLEKLPELVAGYEKTRDNPKASALVRRQAEYDLARLRLLTCEDADFENAKAAFLKLVTDRSGLSVLDYVNFLYGWVERFDCGVMEMPDVDALADAATKEADVQARWRYVEARENRMVKARLRPSLNLREELSDSARLRFLEEMEKDPRLVAHRDDFVAKKASCLRDLGRGPESEKLLLAACETTNAVSLVRFLPQLAALYLFESKRYFDDPHRPTVEKAYAIYDRLVALENAAAKPRPAIRAKWNLAKAEAAATLRDHVTMLAALAAWKSDQPVGREGWQGVLLFGDAYSYAGRYVEAADAYLSLDDKLLKLDHHVRCAEALFACGRRQEAIPHLAFAAKRTGKYQRLRYQHVLDKLNAEFNSEKKESAHEN